MLPSDNYCSSSVLACHSILEVVALFICCIGWNMILNADLFGLAKYLSILYFYMCFCLFLFFVKFSSRDNSIYIHFFLMSMYFVFMDVVHMQCWLWVVLLTVLLPTSAAYSAKRIPRLEEGNCRYDLTSISALSCVRADGRVRRPPSHTCCKALVYAIDRVPVGNVSGACCLCRYMKERTRVSGLATAYILCNGKDKHIVAKWSLFPIKNCSKGTYILLISCSFKLRTAAPYISVSTVCVPSN
jgi:hypothetical protein